MNVARGQLTTDPFGALLDQGGFGTKGSRESSISEVDCATLPQQLPGASSASADGGEAASSCVYINARNMNKGSAGAAHPRFEAYSMDGEENAYLCGNLYKK
jgi:hypothetical protein